MKSQIIIDIREQEEWEAGHIPEALHIPLSKLAEKIEAAVPDKNVFISCYCKSGARAAKAVEVLKEKGFSNVSVARYQRHFSIPEVGVAGQAKLSKAKVLLIGAGGLGSSAAFYLAAAGVGTLGIVDFDKVDLSNLQRQILHTTKRIGVLKVDSAKETLLALNPEIKIETYPVKLTSDNVSEIFKNYDIVVDGSDNFKTRYLVNDACVKLKKPNVHGSIHRFEGQVSVFHSEAGPCYRCIYPEAPPANEAPNCAEAGVLGVLPGVIGTLMATETIKIILDKGDLLVGQLLCFDSLKMEFKKLKLSANADCSCK